MKSTFGIFLVGLSLIVSPTIAFAGGGAPATPVAEVSPDVNGDLKSDFIVEDLTTGFTVVSFLDGVSAPTGSGAISQTKVDAGFTTAGYPDLNGDGKSDKVVVLQMALALDSCLTDSLRRPPRRFQERMWARVT